MDARRGRDPVPVSYTHLDVYKRQLQHQINPHFLYNTLEILRSKALLQGDRDMADAIALLGALYRARMHAKDRIALGEEFELLETYLKIMSMRFRDNFVYQVELDDEKMCIRDRIPPCVDCVKALLVGGDQQDIVSCHEKIPPLFKYPQYRKNRRSGLP